MSFTINIRYTGNNGSANKYAKEMMESGIVEKIRSEAGNLRYEYFTSLDDPETILLIDAWENQEALDFHHASSIMKEIMDLRNKYDLHMVVEKYERVEDNPDDEKYKRK